MVLSERSITRVEGAPFTQSNFGGELRMAGQSSLTPLYARNRLTATPHSPIASSDNVTGSGTAVSRTSSMYPPSESLAPVAANTIDDVPVVGITLKLQTVHAVSPNPTPLMARGMTSPPLKKTAIPFEPTGTPGRGEYAKLSMYGCNAIVGASCSMELLPKLSSSTNWSPSNGEPATWSWISMPGPAIVVHPGIAA